MRRRFPPECYTCYCMCMAEMTRRLQLLLDDERMERLEQRAQADSRSVASLIRQAIDIAYPPTDVARRREAACELLAAAPMPVDDDWSRMKSADRADLYGTRVDGDPA